jgi:hypothetical protein
MKHQRVAVVLAVLAAGLWAGRSAAADGPKKNQPTLTDLSLEVAALQTLHEFKFTPAQMEQLQKLAKETAEKPRRRKAGQGSEDFRAALASLHQALVDDLDDDMIDNLEEQLDGLRDAEGPELDDEVEVTAAARQRAPEVLRGLSPSQVAAYVAANNDEIQNPLERLTDALGKVGGLKPAKWKALRDEVSEEVGRLVAGLDENKSTKVADQVVALLTKARGFKAEEFKKQRPALEKEARRLVGDVHPVEVLRHTAEYALAEMLSNPRLGEALKLRLK